MRSDQKRFRMILAVYAVGGLLLLASFCARRIVGQQTQINVPPAPPVHPLVYPVINSIPAPHIAISVPEIGPIDVPQLNLELNSELNSDLNSELNSELNLDLNANLNSELNSELNRDLAPALSEAIAPTIGEGIAPGVAAGGDVDAEARDDDGFRTTDQETIQKAFAMPASGPKSLDIDNVFGSIEVTADAADKVEMTVVRTNRAESKDKLEKAKKEVTLDISQDGGALKVYVNGPFRCHCDDCRHSRDDDGYVVKMDFQVHVPKDIALYLKTVNEGHVRVRGTNGDFSVRNVNGDIEMDNVSGSGAARTVNGPVKVSFQQNPKENSDFKTVNGNVELKFAHDLSADFRFKTFNGGIYSDFPVTALPLHPMEAEHRGAKVIYRADRYTEARVNAGGPQIQVENLNGDIRILENHE
jgi:hypothetical protein